MSKGIEAHATVPAAHDEAEPGLALMLAVAHGLRSWSATGPGIQRLLADLAAPLRQTAAVLWLPEHNALVGRAVWSSGSGEGVALEPLVRRMKLPSGTGLPGRAWTQCEPVVAEPGAEDGRLRSPSGPELQGTLGLPALADEEVVGVVELYSTTQPELGPQLMHVLAAVSHQLGAFFHRRRGQLQLSSLTAREVEVLILAARGLPVSRIGEQLSISRGTVKSHLEHIYTKLGAANRTAAVARALRTGLIE
jgi:DNA-binding CsgD family transcriptional regulator